MGKMQCLGMHMAQIEAKILLVRVCQKSEEKIDKIDDNFCE